jgi:hypothetical protein
MPITPAHIGPVILIGALGGKKLNLSVLIISVILIDIEHLFLGIKYGDLVYHGFWHTFGGAALYGFLLGTIYFSLMVLFWRVTDYRYKQYQNLKKLRDSQKLNWTYSYKCILISAVIGAYAHISLDWLLYDNISVFAFFYGNMYNDFSSEFLFSTVIFVYLFCLVTFIAGLALYAYRFAFEKNRKYRISSIYSIKMSIKDLWAIIGIVVTPFAISGTLIITIILYLGIHNPELLEGHLNGSLLILSIISILLMVIGYHKSLKNVNWKLIE